jgi:large subunit ribosomal protein L17
LAESLIIDESIKTTMPKAKAVVRYTEKILSKAKLGKDNLSKRRQVISALNSIEAAHKLVEDIAPKLASRQSGYFRIEKLGTRRGDNALMAKVSFVDELKGTKKSPKTQPAAKPSEESDEKQPAAELPQATQTMQDSDSKIQPKITPQAPKRSGVRGNR